MKTEDLTEKLKGLQGYESRIPAHYEDSYNGLNNHEKVVLYTIHSNRLGIMPYKRGYIKDFDLNKKEVNQIIKDLFILIFSIPAFSEDSGLLAGRGYMIDIEKLNELLKNVDQFLYISTEDYLYNKQHCQVCNEVSFFSTSESGKTVKLKCKLCDSVYIKDEARNAFINITKKSESKDYSNMFDKPNDF